MNLSDNELVLEPTSGSEEFLGWVVTIDGQRIGTVALREEGSGTVSVRWNLGRGNESMWLAARALQLVVTHAFDERGYTRIEARVPADRMDDIRAASIGGLRREGIVRGAGDDPDRALLARLVDDPPVNSREGFIALLNAGLPTKRIIAQGRLRDEHGRVLLCQLTYKREWDLPGGVVEVGELLTVNWLPAWRGWDDACVFLFDLGEVESTYIDTMKLQPTEIVGVEWCDDDAVREHATAAATELLAAVDAGDLPPYREAPSAPE